MELKLANSSDALNLSDDVFSVEFNEPLIHQIVTAYMAGARAGTKAQKTRAEVSGGGVKPWKQKGTGRARAGTIRSPLWRHGGKIFAAKPRSFMQKVNKKMHRGAIRSILSELIRQDRFLAVGDFKVESHRTKDFIAKLKPFGLTGKVLIITDDIDENLYLSSRNVPHVFVCDTAMAAADPVTLVGMDHVIISSAAIKELEGVLS